MVNLARRLLGKKPVFEPRQPAPKLVPRKKPNLAALRAQFAESRLDREPDTFVLYRIIGNDLYPRHAKGQSRENVRFILENEPNFDNCEKRWIVNRIVDRAEEACIIRTLENQGQPYLHIGFDWDQYRRIPWNFESFPPAFFLRGPYSEMAEYDRVLAEAQIRRYKNIYAMNNNGARNAALRDGRGRAKWVLPWDGNCFLTKAAWNELVSAVKEQPYLKYFLVPMARTTDNQSLLNSSRFEATEEPQILFRRDAKEEFNESFPYGRRPKVELFWRLGVPGMWDKWGDDVWDPPRRGLSDEAGQFGYAGWVARLSSGRSQFETPSKKSLVDRALGRTASDKALARTASIRALARTESIKTTLDFLDEQALKLSFDENTTTAYSEKLLDELRCGWERERREARLVAKLRKAADAALKRGSCSVADKKTLLPPGGDFHDRWHPSPPKSADGLTSVWQDGIGVAEAGLYEPEGEKFDRTQLQRLFHDTTILALAWRVTGEQNYTNHAAECVRTWFIRPGTRISPDRLGAKVQYENRNSAAARTGVIDMKDFYYFLDGVRLVERAGTFDASDRQALTGWLRDYVKWLLTSQQGEEARRANNNLGTCFDLQLVAIAQYLGDIELLVSTLRTSQERLLEQFESNGRQRQEMKETLTAHYCCFNLQTWANLAYLAQRCGIDLWNIAASDGRGLRRAFEWMAPYIAGKAWDSEQEEPFDRQRFIPLYFAALDHYGEMPGLNKNLSLDRSKLSPLFCPQDGIKPFWMLG